MKSITLEVADITEARLAELSRKCDATPGEFVDLVCESLDDECLARVIEQAITDESVTSLVAGVGRMPERRAVRGN